MNFRFFCQYIQDILRFDEQQLSSTYEVKSYTCSASQMGFWVGLELCHVKHNAKIVLVILKVRNGQISNQTAPNEDSYQIIIRWRVWDGECGMEGWGHEFVTYYVPQCRYLQQPKTYPS